MDTKARFLSIIAALLVVTGLSLSANANLVTNGGFEDGKFGEVPTDWNVGSYGGEGEILKTDDQKYQGEAALKMNRHSSEHLEQTWVYQDIDVTANTDYNFSFQGKVIEANEYESSNQLFLLVQDVNTDGVSTTDDALGYLLVQQDIDGAGSWVYKEGTFNSGDRTQVRIVCANAPNWRGNYRDSWTDEVEVTAVPEPMTMSILALGIGGMLLRR